MSATLTTPAFSVGLSATLTSASGASKNTSQISHALSGSPTVGTASGNVNKEYSADLTVAANGTPTSIDLTNLTDNQGNAITVATLATLILSNSSTVTGQNLLLSTTVANQLFTFSAPIPPNLNGAAGLPGAIAIALGTAGLTVDSSHKIVYVDVAAGTNVPFRLTLLGK